jgi:hypothetical protein
LFQGYWEKNDIRLTYKAERREGDKGTQAQRNEKSGLREPTGIEGKRRGIILYGASKRNSRVIFRRPYAGKLV